MRPSVPDYGIRYDAVLIMSTYKRNELVQKTLAQLRDEPTRYRVKLLVLNDGNALDDMQLIIEENPEVLFLHNSKNNGKRQYWKTITTLLQEASKIRYEYLIQIDDDHEPVNRFFDTIISHIRELEPDTILKYVTNENGADWGYSHWVDGGTAYPRAFLDDIGHRIRRIPHERWWANPQASSGVWMQVTQKLNQFDYKVECLSNSMANHLGYKDSVMNTALRREKQLRTLNFSKEWQGDGTRSR